MKWPHTAWFLRHAQSAFNIQRGNKMQDPEYQAFVAAFDSDPLAISTQAAARRMWEKYRLNHGDWNTPITEEGRRQAVETGRGLPRVIDLPNTILISPHDRAWQTLEALQQGWPELKTVEVVEEPRLHEQDHGLAAVYSDWRIFHAIYPEQAILHEEAGPYWYRYPQGENVFDVVERMRTFIGTLTRDYAERKVGVISHHITILAFMAAIHRWNQREFIDWDEHRKPINCGLTIYQGNPEKGQNGRFERKDYNMKLY